ncbi:hypothetical protein KEJ34_09350 [Candidatus Bathyarchaeota archaeon]|nr:hypothetical protein [Candidatus Bathyarchaeota archaeon]
MSIFAHSLRKTVVAMSNGDVKIDNIIKSIPPTIKAIGGFLAANSNTADMPKSILITSLEYAVTLLQNINFL